MKIAIFTDTYIPETNGVVTSITTFTKLLADDGNEIMIFCPKYGSYRDKKYPNIRVKRFASVSFATNKEVKIAIPSMVAVMKQVREFGPDVVHIQTPMGIGAVGLLATKALKMKNIQTYHTYLPDFMVYLKPRTIFKVDRIVSQLNSSKVMLALLKMELYEGDAGDKNTLQKILAERKAVEKTPKVKPGALTKFAWNYTRVTYNRACLVLTPSMALKKELKKHNVKTRVEVMSNGIDYDLFKKKTDYHIKNKMVHIGRLGFEKNVDVLIKAFEIAQKTKPELTLDIWGGGPALEPLKVLAKKLQLEDKIKFTGFYDRKNAAKALYKYDFFVTAATMETQGLVILEAMAAGLPALGPDKLAVPEVIHDGQNGYLSKPFDAAGMAKNMLKMLESDEKLEKFGKKSLSIAERHEIVKCKNRLFEFYKQVANEKKAIDL